MVCDRGQFNYGCPGTSYGASDSPPSVVQLLLCTGGFYAVCINKINNGFQSRHLHVFCSADVCTGVARVCKGHVNERCRRESSVCKTALLMMNRLRERLDGK